MNKLDYIKALRDAQDGLDLLSDLFSNPLSAAAQGCAFPDGHKYLMLNFLEQLHELDRRVVTEPESDNTNAIYSPIWKRINLEILEPLDKLFRCLNSKDCGISSGLQCVGDYARELQKLEAPFKSICADATYRCGFKCIHHKDGVCAGGFTKKETKCNGMESCECFDLGIPELER